MSAHRLQDHAFEVNAVPIVLHGAQRDLLHASFPNFNSPELHEGEPFLRIRGVHWDRQDGIRAVADHVEPLAGREQCRLRNFRF